MRAQSASRLVRLAAISGGTLLAGVGLLGDWIGLGKEQGIGERQLVAIVIGCVIAIWGAVRPRTRASRLIARSSLVIVSTYTTLLIGEFALPGLLSPSNDRALWTLRGLFRTDTAAGYANTPLFRGTLDDGHVTVAIRLNSLGDRDDEPKDSPGGTRVLLLGDSFAFGYGLPRAATIEGAIEELGNGRWDVYNLGVIAYGPRNVAAHFEASDWWRGDRVVYLFFNNDLADVNLKLDRYRVMDGYLLHRYSGSGRPYTDEELRRKISRRNRKDRIPMRQQILGHAMLLDLRGLLSLLLDPEAALNAWPPNAYSSDGLSAAIVSTQRMRDLTLRRGAQFSVAIAPTVGEAKWGRYSENTAAYIDAIRREGIETIEFLARLEESDYFEHDPHFSTSGAGIAAEAILEHLRSP